jgi:hypothetical protein
LCGPDIYAAEALTTQRRGARERLRCNLLPSHPPRELNKQVVSTAEAYGLDFALSMIKLHGFGGKTEFWDHGLESFTLMAGLAAITCRIRLSVRMVCDRRDEINSVGCEAVHTFPPARREMMASKVRQRIWDIRGISVKVKKNRRR